MSNTKKSQILELLKGVGSRRPLGMVHIGPREEDNCWKQDQKELVRKDGETVKSWTGTEI